MKKDIQQMNHIWDNFAKDKTKATSFPMIDFNQILGTLFSTGPFYFFIFDYFDLSLSKISSGFFEAHGIHSSEIYNYKDILSLIHPEDVFLVSKAEERAFAFMKNHVGMEKIKSYKFTYNIRFRNAKGEYDLYNHQSLVLSTDEQNNFVKALNIHTKISHLTTKNTHTFSLIGINGNPSFLNLPINKEVSKSTLNTNFSLREIEIIKLIAEGESTKSIADRLFISSETVKTHRRNIFKKSDCNSAAELTARSISEGWI